MKKTPAESSGLGEAPSPATHPPLQLKLFVAGNTPLSARAIVNLRKFCDDHLVGAYTLEIVDLSVNPREAELAQIFATPTLVKLTPLPTRRFVGDLSDTTRLEYELGLRAKLK